MKKYSLTSSGIREFQEELFRKDDEQLLGESAIVAGDCLAYLLQRFEIDVLLLESLRSVDVKMARTIGWCLAAALVNRQPFSMEGPLLTTIVSVTGDISGRTISLKCPLALQVTQ